MTEADRLQETARRFSRILAAVRDRINMAAGDDRGRIAAELAPDLEKAAAEAQAAWTAYFMATDGETK